ncbi:hypothetical protein ILUMI_19634 [Ignelater luminosus]|uniref:DDE-1 domain-containing protein n=1 Tax=Ignelater luminosus TaxID=2038154 RepID=A0A8K0CFT7_IGNLU|nr:hypothetical protein ILUMI_19634 [Ignelater luminosus]
MNEGKSVNAAAKEFYIKRMTLTRFIKKLKSQSGTPSMGYATSRQLPRVGYQFIQHFIKHVKPSNEHRVLLVLDNHSSHLHVETLNLAKENGIVMLSFPPHFSHKSQPLDVSVFGPFKKYCASSQDIWLRNNPGKTITIYDIPKIVADSLPLAQTSRNIMNGFQKTGIFSFNPSDPAVMHARKLDSVTASTSQAEEEAGTSYKENVEFDPPRRFSPEIVRPYPKAGPRKIGTAIRRRRKAAILTDTPENNKLQEEQNKTTEKVKNQKHKIDEKGRKVFVKNFSSQARKTMKMTMPAWFAAKPIPKVYQGKNGSSAKFARNGHIHAGLTHVCINCDSDNDD